MSLKDKIEIIFVAIGIALIGIDLIIKLVRTINSNNGTTIITSNGNLPMIIKVRGLKGE